MVKKHRQICFSLLFCFNQISGHFCFILKGKSLVILGRVPEIYTNIHHLYMGYVMVFYRAIWEQLLGYPPKGTHILIFQAAILEKPQCKSLVQCWLGPYDGSAVE